MLQQKKHLVSLQLTSIYNKLLQSKMIGVFLADIENKRQAKTISKIVKHHFPALSFNIDLKDSNLPFPCGHSIIRVEGDKISSLEIISLIQTHGIKCDILEDKICK